MEIWYMVLIALSLNFDDFAICVTSGLILKQFFLKRSLGIAIIFAGPQTLLLFLGWLGGTTLATVLSSIANWVAFVILCLVGGKMLYEGLGHKNQKECEEKGEKMARKLNPMHLGVMVILGFATSFDALAVGVSLGLFRETILWQAFILFGVTACIACGGLYLGTRFAKIPEEKLEILGGLILIGLALFILIGTLII